MDEEYNDSFYPFIDYITECVSDIELEEDDTLPLYREIAWDFKNEHPLVINYEFNTYKIFKYLRCCNSNDNILFCGINIKFTIYC